MKLVAALLASVTICRCFPLQSGVMPNTPENVAKLASGNYIQAAWEISDQFEGDMVLTPEQMKSILYPRNGMISKSRRWRNNVVPYTIDESAFTQDHIDFIDLHVKKFAQVSCVKVRRKIPRDVDYIEITGERIGCRSYIGRQKGKQQLNLHPHKLNKGCFTPASIQHEFMHAIGFVHQQSASNRDDYVTIVWENVKPGKEHNLRKYDDEVSSSFGVPYDYASIMHYSEYANSANGKRTIIPKDETAVIGKSKSLSEKDIKKLNLMYCSN